MGAVGPRELSTTLQGDMDQKEHTGSLKENAPSQRDWHYLGGMALSE